MTQSHTHQIDPRLDLVMERLIDVPPELVWAAWTTPEHIKKWFTPAPWTTPECEIDLRPGGIFRTVMRSPEGEEHSNLGCYLEIVQNERLVWTDALAPGYRPSSHSNCIGSFMTAAILLEPHGKGTKYTAIAKHKDEESCAKHKEMGFHEGWGTVLDQLIAVARQM